MQFTDLVERICAKSPFQRKRLEAYLKTCDDKFFREADKFAQRYGSFLSEQNISIDYAVDAYLKMCGSMMRCQVDFLRSGRYPVASAEQARQDVYESKEEMLSYMVALGISQFLWSTHYRMFSFFNEAIDERGTSITRYLEIGPGHGIFLESALARCPDLKQALAIDISPTSLDLAKSILTHFMPDLTTIEFVLADVTASTFSGQFDFITMGEVLEHVDDPGKLLRSLRPLLAPGGKAFVSTCANCPAIDHVYQFNSVEDIRAMIKDSGLRIVRDLPMPVENMDITQAEAQRITINYCALVE